MEKEAEEKWKWTREFPRMRPYYRNSATNSWLRSCLTRRSLRKGSRRNSIRRREMECNISQLSSPERHSRETYPHLLIFVFVILQILSLPLYLFVTNPNKADNLCVCYKFLGCITDRCTLSCPRFHHQLLHGSRDYAEQMRNAFVQNLPNLSRML